MDSQAVLWDIVSIISEVWGRPAQVQEHVGPDRAETDEKA